MQKKYPFFADQKYRTVEKFLSVSSHMFRPVIVLQGYPCSVELFSTFLSVSDIFCLVVIVFSLSFSQFLNIGRKTVTLEEKIEIGALLKIELSQRQIAKTLGVPKR